MTRINFSKHGFTPFQKLMGHNERIMTEWSNLEECVFNSNTFTPELKEEIRRTLAFNNGCEYCMAKGKPSNEIKDSKILMATRIADFISKNHNIDDKHFDLLKSEFDDSEISELLALICFITASQKFGALLNLQPSCPI